MVLRGTPGARHRTRPSRYSIFSWFAMMSLRLASASGVNGILPSGGSTPTGRAIAHSGSFGRSLRLYENSLLARLGARLASGTSGGSMPRGSGIARYSPEMSGCPSAVRGGTYVLAGRAYGGYVDGPAPRPSCAPPIPGSSRTPHNAHAAAIEVFT